MKTEDDRDDRDTRPKGNDRGAWTKLGKAIGWTTRAAFRHHAVVRADGKDCRRCLQVCLDPTRTAPDGQEPTESAQHASAQSAAAHNEWSKPEPPDARRSGHGDAEGERLVVAPVWRADKESRARGGKTIEAAAAHAHAEQPAEAPQGEAQESIARRGVRPRLLAEPGDPLPCRRWGQRITAV